MTEVDAAVVGSGPNGLSAAVTLARAGLRVRVYEAAQTIGGGARTAELTVPGFRHDVCSAVHPQALASPFFRAFGLEKRVSFVVPELSYAHPLDGGVAGLAYRDLGRTAESLGVDGAAWRRLLEPLLDRLDGVLDFTGGTMLRAPRDPVAAFEFAVRALAQGTRAWNVGFAGGVAPAMLAGVAAHAGGALPSLGSAGAGLLLATLAHAGGWPIPVGGSQAIVDAMADDLRAHGGEIVTGAEVHAWGDLPSAQAVLFDTSPRDLVRIVGSRVPERYRRRIERFRYASAVAKVDFALDAPVPWANPEVADAGTVHLGGTRSQIAAAEREVRAGRHPGWPYALVSQPSRFDASRAPEGKHVLWAYTHVPLGSEVDPTEMVTEQIERSAPGFRDVVIASAWRSAAQIEEHNSNYVGGDISGGEVSIAQLFCRPVLSRAPWATPIRGVYLCSSSTPPGPSVHGLNGWFAAIAALRVTFGTRQIPALGA
ncbi:MAG TPA: NAD(P)/FAD-dependent oxidoreductase [Lacisediminihabitans sp.]|uniref:phytoene desaturase family protein n=1 Tax=Lacisediminihabitans sp. TaxID=2787631 RepID=UPI002ED94954